MAAQGRKAGREAYKKVGREGGRKRCENSCFILC